MKGLLRASRRELLISSKSSHEEEAELKSESESEVSEENERPQEEEEQISDSADSAAPEFRGLFTAKSSSGIGDDWVEDGFEDEEEEEEEEEGEDEWTMMEESDSY